MPNVTIRYCTEFLKRERVESFARDRLGLRRWHAVIRLRADEPRRVPRMRTMNCGSRTGAHAAPPLAEAGVAEHDVLAWWKAQPFDLDISLRRQEREHTDEASRFASVGTQYVGICRKAGSGATRRAKTGRLVGYGAQHGMGIHA